MDTKAWNLLVNYVNIVQINWPWIFFPIKTYTPLRQWLIYKTTKGTGWVLVTILNRKWNYRCNSVPCDRFIDERLLETPIAFNPHPNVKCTAEKRNNGVQMCHHPHIHSPSVVMRSEATYTQTHQLNDHFITSITEQKKNVYICLTKRSTKNPTFPTGRQQ